MKKSNRQIKGKKTKVAAIPPLLVFAALTAAATFSTLGAYAAMDNIADTRRVVSALTHELPLKLQGKGDFEIGQYYFNAGPDADGTYNLRLARRYYERVVAQDPEGNPQAWYQLGRIYFLNGDFNRALRYFGQQLVYFGDEVPEVYYMLGLAHGYRARAHGAESDWQRAEDYFLKYIEYDETSAWPRVDLAWVYFSVGDYEKVEVTAEAGLKYWPSNPWLLNMRGLAKLNQGQSEEAAADFRSALVAAEILTPVDWGSIYPGNNPQFWPEGLEEFKEHLESNLALAMSTQGGDE